MAILTIFARHVIRPTRAWGSTGRSSARVRGRPWALDQHGRSFFGLGEVIGILANPSETVRSLAESKRLLEETRAEMLEQKERNSIPPRHTFSPLPGLQYRSKEVQVLKTCLSSIPNFTVIFGGTSVGKTALLRQVLTNERYHVIHFDLRMAGFADVSSLFFSFSCQMEQYFVGLARRLEGYEVFEKEALAFKHLRLDIQRRMERNGPPVKTSDVAHLLEIFQSCLLKYWEFSPANPDEKEESKERISNKPVEEWERKKMQRVTDRVKQEMSFAADHDPARVHASSKPSRDHQTPGGMEASRAVEFPAAESSSSSSSHAHLLPASQEEDRHSENQSETSQDEEEETSRWKPPTKLIPVFFIDEAHKLPALIKDQETMKCILDGLLVLTKQDRLCHVINATSDPFYMNWLRTMNVLTHCTIITIGDPTRAEAEEYFNTHLVHSLRKKLEQQQQSAIICETRDRPPSGNMVLKHERDQASAQKESSPAHHHPQDTYELGFELIYDTFGGKLAHMQGFVGDYLNSGGRLKPRESSPFLQAYALLQHQLIHGQHINLRGDSEQPSSSTSPKYTQCGVPIRADVGDGDGSVYGHGSGGVVENYREGGEKLEGRCLLYVISKFTTGYEVERSTGRILVSDGTTTRRSTPASSSSSSSSGDSRPGQLAVEGTRPIKRSHDARHCTYPYFRLCREIGVRSVDHLIRQRILDLRWTPPVSMDADDDDDDDDHHHQDSPASRLPVEPLLLPISPVMRAAMHAVLDQHWHENLLHS
ncbi:hypothetical protein PCANC_16539 [Puccinia coronata f. sp. avenae]|uniref:ATPase domain-containing protein n=1 Tax=Puccinia coronata f. sp. avenae TaxID=200324 RepID=A0A2N5ULT6_9BASI|nr:hypothetical protein PCANC_16539 [Puccinia coronata f. sp. avenae]